ncbi:MAG: hypothetical protein R2568_10790 [Candidatus Scalindua sp.]|nr:hypothetical protein [Candidatus Scalindua sp.]
MEAILSHAIFLSKKFRFDRIATTSSIRQGRWGGSSEDESTMR